MPGATGLNVLPSFFPAAPSAPPTTAARTNPLTAPPLLLLVRSNSPTRTTEFGSFFFISFVILDTLFVDFMFDFIKCLYIKKLQEEAGYHLNIPNNKIIERLIEEKYKQLTEE